MGRIDDDNLGGGGLVARLQTLGLCDEAAAVERLGRALGDAVDAAAMAAFALEAALGVLRRVDRASQVDHFDDHAGPGRRDRPVGAHRLDSIDRADDTSLGEQGT